MDTEKIIVAILVVLTSVILHELAHGLVAYALGDSTAKEQGRLTLNPLKHLDPVLSLAVPVFSFLVTGVAFGGAKPVPVDSRNLKGGAWGMALVAVAGPLTNFILSLLSFLIGHFTGILYTGTDLPYLIISQLIMVNLSFFVFNILPIPPLDGSRVLYAIAPDGARSVMEKLEQTVGVWLVFILLIVSGSFFSRLIGNMAYGVLSFFYFLVGIH